jgi:hypothetical protein
MALARFIAHFFEGVHCGSDVLTWTGRCLIGGISCHVRAPSPVPAWISDSLGVLEPPLNEMWHKDPCWPTDGWGMINSKRTVTIDAVGMELVDDLIGSDDDLLQFDKAVSCWMAAFGDWLAVFSGGPTSFETRESSMKWVSEDRNRNLIHACYRAGEIWEPEPMSRWQWNHAFQHTINNDDPPFAQKLLALATRYAVRADSRNAVIHAATAAECALTNGLLRHLSHSHSLEEAQTRLKRNRMLGRRLQIAEELGLKVPIDARQSLLEPRNATVHSGQRITGDQAWKAVWTAASIVNTFDPLSEHCQEPIIYANEEF